jgi:hypothetical protein
MDQTTTRTLRSRQRLLGWGGVVGIVVLTLGDLITPHGTDQHITTVPAGLAELKAAHAHPATTYVAFLLVVLGFFGLAVGFLALATLVRERGARLATAAGGIGLFACFSAAVINVWAGLDVYAAVKADMSRSSAAAFLVSAQHTSAVSAVFALGYFVGLLLAGVLAGAALWRSRVVPRWVGIVFPVSLAVAAGSPSGVPGTALAVPFAALMAWLCVTAVWSARPEPVEDPTSQIASTDAVREA